MGDITFLGYLKMDMLFCMSTATYFGRLLWRLNGHCSIFHSTIPCSDHNVIFVTQTHCKEPANTPSRRRREENSRTANVNVIANENYILSTEINFGATCMTAPACCRRLFVFYHHSQSIDDLIEWPNSSTSSCLHCLVVSFPI